MLNKSSVSCPICKGKKTKIIWDSKIRAGKNLWTKDKRKISQCETCDVVFLNKRSEELIDNSIFRKKFDGDNSIKKYSSFNKPREKYKLNIIKKFLQFKNKKVMESNCGAATNLDLIKNEAKITAGLDNLIYKKHVEKNHIFFSSLKDLKKNKIMFDIILSLSEIEHQKNIYKFLSTLKNKITSKGMIVFRIPNYNNIYRYMLSKKFLNYDFRLSHNFYFSEKVVILCLKKLDLKSIKKLVFKNILLIT